MDYLFHGTNLPDEKKKKGNLKIKCLDIYKVFNIFCPFISSE